MSKIIFFIIITVVSLCVALIPEAAMYFTWHLIAPETEIGRIVVLGIFWLGGAGISIMFAMFGFLLWCAGMEQL